MNNLTVKCFIYSRNWSHLVPIYHRWIFSSYRRWSILSLWDQAIHSGTCLLTCTSFGRCYLGPLAMGISWRPELFSDVKTVSDVNDLTVKCFIQDRNWSYSVFNLDEEFYRCEMESRARMKMIWHIGSSNTLILLLLCLNILFFFRILRKMMLRQRRRSI